MHCKTLAVVEIPAGGDDFSWQVNEEVMKMMEPYWTETEDERYLAFEDRTEELKDSFQQKIVCLRLAEGKVVELRKYPYCNSYIVRDGKVYQRIAGPLRHEKRTKAAKRITALPDYPRARLYKSFEDYAENDWGISYDTEHNGYGYYCNPKGMWDWYQIGGRWPNLFLVKDTCAECCEGEYSWCVEKVVFEAPKGFCWVAAARKKDIEWQAMGEWKKKKAAERFACLEKMFLSGRLEKGFYGEITENGIFQGGEWIYRKGESVNAYLERTGILQNRKYPFAVGDIVDMEHWFSRDEVACRNTETGEIEAEDWWIFLEKYVDELADDAVLVGVDYHM